MRISVVSTLYKSSPYIAEFVERMRLELNRLTSDYEIILVDDGSPDDSLRVALSLMEREPQLRVIELSRNFGHHKAMMTGLEHASGDLVFLIDSDLEEPPELLSVFNEKLTTERLDVVYGFQESRKGRFAERFLGWIAWQMIRLMLPIRVPRNSSTVRLMNRPYVQALIRHKESKTAIGGLWVITGFQQGGLAFHKGSRDTTSYSFGTRLFTLLDSITSFSEMPLYFVFFMGLLVLLMSAVIACWLLYSKMTGHVLQGWVSTLFSVWFLGGLAIFSIGVVGLYISRIFVETKNRPYTIIRQIHEK
jgi:putative glycosyltransferase